ncbi:MAG TPA: hypothetical protein VL463_32110 [Kofleriaceae bacterium]|nr:hypothetical protein [Kofleriaceae bacterium]
MRTLLIIAAVSAPVAAWAQATPAAVPFTCESVAIVPNEMHSTAPLMQARISMASCAAEARMGALTLVDDDVSMQLLASSIEPSLATLDDVAANGDPRWQLLAAHARAEIYLGMVARMRATIPPIPPGEREQLLVNDLADRAERHAVLEPKLRAWIDQADRNLRLTLQIANASASAMQDDACAIAARDAQEQLAIARTP